MLSDKKKPVKGRNQQDNICTDIKKVLKQSLQYTYRVLSLFKLEFFYYMSLLTCLIV